MTDFVNCYASDRLTPLAYYRLTFSESGFASFFGRDTLADTNFHWVYDQIAQVTPLVPTIPYPWAPGMRSMVVDVKATNHASSVSCAGAASVLNGILMPIDIERVELLHSAADVTNGSAARAQQATAADAARPSLASVLPGASAVGSVLSDVGGGLKWGLIAAGIIAAALLVHGLEEW